MTKESLLKSYGCTSVSPLSKGWSRDIKYIFENARGEKYLLRVSEPALYERKREQFALLKQLESLGLNCSRPVEFGTFEDGSVYMILSFLDGVDGVEAVSGMDDGAAYRLGKEAGKLLKTLHALPIPKQEKTWWDRYLEKMPRKIDALLHCEYSLPHRELILSYYRDNYELMRDRPLTFVHGDYHLGNMIVKDGKIGIIDFDKTGVADPIDDLKPFCWNAMRSEWFETGLINGYFDDSVPDGFFKLLKFYTAETLISHLPWAVGFGQAEVDTALTVAQCQMRWYRDFTLTVPTWYKGVL